VNIHVPVYEYIYPYIYRIWTYPCGRLSWLPVSFLLHVKYPLSYRIVQLSICYKKYFSPEIVSFIVVACLWYVGIYIADKPFVYAGSLVYQPSISVCKLAYSEPVPKPRGRKGCGRKGIQHKDTFRCMAELAVTLNPLLVVQWEAWVRGDQRSIKGLVKSRIRRV